MLEGEGDKQNDADWRENILSFSAILCSKTFKCLGVELRQDFTADLTPLHLSWILCKTAPR